MQIGAKIIRKSDVSKAIAVFGILESVKGVKARVCWTVNGRELHSTLALASLSEVTPELEQDVRTRAKARYDAYQEKLDRERIYLCTNVNPRARVSNDGHPKPMPLAPGQTVNMEGKLCLYCGKPVVLREEN